MQNKPFKEILKAGWARFNEKRKNLWRKYRINKFIILFLLIGTRAFDTYESKKHPESPRGLIFFVKFISYILRDLA